LSVDRRWLSNHPIMISLTRCSTRQLHSRLRITSCSHNRNISSKFSTSSDNKDKAKPKRTLKEMMKEYGPAAVLTYASTYATFLAAIYLAIDSNVATLVSPSFDFAANLNNVSCIISIPHLQPYQYPSPRRHAITFRH
jgi:hypothetical protein